MEIISNIDVCADYIDLSVSSNLQRILDLRFETLEINGNLDFSGVAEKKIQNVTVGEALKLAHQFNIPHNVVGSKWYRVHTPYGVLVEEHYAQNMMRGESIYFSPNEELLEYVQQRHVKKLLTGQVLPSASQAKFDIVVEYQTVTGVPSYPDLPKDALYSEYEKYRVNPPILTGRIELKGVTLRDAWNKLHDEVVRRRHWLGIRKFGGVKFITPNVNYVLESSLKDDFYLEIDKGVLVSQ